MILLHPVWLLLVIPMAVSLWLLKPASRLLQVLRVITVVLILLAMSGLSLKLPSRRGTVVVIADRSSSMPPDTTAKQKEAIDLIQSEMATRDNLAVVSFGETAMVERPPQGGKFPGFVTETNSEASNLAQAIEMAISLTPQDAPGRILIISDGRWTGRNPVSAASQAAVRTIPIDYRLLERAATNDLAIFRIDAPQIVSPGESFLITVWVQSPLQQEVSYKLYRGKDTIATAAKTISSGLTRLTFRDSATQPGTIQYGFVIVAAPDDPVPENNTARILLGVQGQKPVLCVTNSSESGLTGLIQKGRINVQASLPSSCNWSLEDLSGFSAVLIENVPAEKIGTTAMENISAWVRESGAGFMMTGGKNSYGPGGYFKSPLEPIMPVSMELRREHRKLSLAIVVALDRSGSMAARVGGGKTKMDLANLAAVQVLDLLSPMDEFGVIAVDSSPHVIVNLDPVEKNANLRNRILRIQSMGGGIFIYEALSNAAKMLAAATPQTRHIILFADAADSEEPGKYVELLEKCTQAGITVSVIGLGKPSDVDAWLLEDIAARGQGRCFFTESPSELPRLFAQDTFVVARSSFLEEPTSIETTAGLISLTGRQFNVSHKIGGYNLCYLRPNANLAVATIDEYQAPVVVAWQVGIGRSLCYTGQADGPFTGDIAQWEEIGDFFSSLTRWTVGDTSGLGTDMLLTQQVKSGICLIQLHLDPERRNQTLIDLPKVATLHGTPGQTPKTRKVTMQFQDADTIAVEIPISGSETALSTVEVPGFAPITLPPVCLPYSPEFKPVQHDQGVVTMAQLARLTQGRERINLTDIWEDLPRQPQMISMAPWLLFVAIILLLLEVFQRRTGLLSARRWRLFRLQAKPKISKQPVTKDHKKSVRAEETAQKTPSGAQQSDRLVKREEKPTPAKGLLTALSKARRSAKARTDRNK